jgi:hypothetical protein
LETFETISLRDVALRLAKIRQPTTNRIHEGRLLSLLRSGALTAGFEFPGPARRWISLDSNYWLTVDGEKFASIRSDGARTYKIKITDCAEAFSKAVFGNKRTESSAALSKEELARVLMSASARFEVVIQAQELQRYLDSEGIKENPFDWAPTTSRGGGTPPKQAWNKLAVIIPACLLAHHEKHPERPKFEPAAMEIIAIAAEHGVSPQSLPAKSTLEDTLSKIYTEKERILNG